MTNVVVRPIPFAFDASVPFQWQPDNPNFGVLCNSFTFFVVPFERYIVATVRELSKSINDDEVAAEADAFLKQEAQHASAHRKHMLSLIEKYPGLDEIYVNVGKMFDAQWTQKPLEYHLAYIANIEATFTPLMKVFLDNRESLFAGGDRRVASLMMWHFVEEIEHRSSALILSRYVTPNPWYRVKRAKTMFGHVNDVMMEIVRGFDKHVPLEDRGVCAVAALTSGLFAGELKRRLPFVSPSVGGDGVPSVFHAVPTKTLLSMIWRLVLSQAPTHDPADQPLPGWVDLWMGEYERGTDMTTFYGIPPAMVGRPPAPIEPIIGRKPDY
ncbi:metal-dependent hydrolase [Mycolicibacterium moriokaense]|uniref:Putative metal-dependent hydrolase n=1 Tax=Mycolicibacterium moriokaense TaxID=39691 RepID=A0A318H8S2_9MYCO|nr:metal-dependent hydrolase [Mycolicibacterium moriokaense]PXX01634.1 putative metal-dependent hydrolase [Mycolicibacterium moriokaense]